VECVVCGSKLGNRNKHGYCQKHRNQSEVVKQQKAKYSSNWWFKNNPDKSVSKISDDERKRRARDRMREIRSRNPDSYKVRNNQRDKDRRSTDLNYRIASNMRSRLSKALTGKVKKSSAVSDLGCSLEDFRSYLESKFEPGMTWQNYGKGEGKWNIDHIKPLANADLSDIEVQKKLSHFSNLRPMWHIDNIKKGNKHEHEQMDEKTDK
jgi:hypothetical protein